MFTTETQIKVRYAEVDQMGYLHHSRYAQYYEVGRTDMINKFYKSYREFEKAGIMMPVIELKCKFHAPAKYDDLITVKTTLKELPQTRIVFTYELFNEAGKKVNSGETTLVFVNSETRRPMRAPKDFLEALEPNFKLNGASCDS